MRRFLSKLRLFFRYSILKSIVFNFHHLPFRQACKLPIWLRKPHLHCIKGRIVIDAPIRPGMIRLGGFGGHMYPDSGISITQWGGEIVFKGSCMIGNNSFICQGKESTIIFGDDFIATTSLNLISFNRVEFGEHVGIGWDVIFMDTNYETEMKKNRRVDGRIKIGAYNWFGNQCKVMHSVETPERCIFGMGSILTRECKFETYCVHGGSPLRILSRNVMRLHGNDVISDYSKD